MSSHLSHSFIIPGTHLSLPGKGIQEAKLVRTVFDTDGLLLLPPPIYVCVSVRAHVHMCVCVFVCLPACLSVSLPELGLLQFGMGWDKSFVF